jgi:hypothetical protein
MGQVRREVWSAMSGTTPTGEATDDDHLAHPCSCGIVRRRERLGRVTVHRSQRWRCDMLTPMDDLIGRELRDSDNQPVGKITAVYQYPTDLNAPWGAVAISQGLIRRSTHLVDLEQAALEDEAVRVPHTRQIISTAPNYPPMVGGTLADHHAADVRAHYWGAAQPA